MKTKQAGSARSWYLAFARTTFIALLIAAVISLAIGNAQPIAVVVLVEIAIAAKWVTRFSTDKRIPQPQRAIVTSLALICFVGIAMIAVQTLFSS